MRLKLVKLAGFKSFVDPTTVSFAHNLSAVVGPNGCGKSNIIDAVRWVMGESSAKNLRGQSMTDVIFNGSSGRKPVGQASIELVFDNSDGTVQGEYAAFAEISVKRKVDRNSENHYFLNGQKCRRRDITDIFLGTGLGPRSYAIIEQGMISKLIEAKPEELRIYIEEAAGISKYKERRRETETRMRRTHENLERLTDIRDELEKQLQHLYRQAQSAEKYSEYKKQERLVKAQLQAVQWRDFDQRTANSEQAIGQQELAVEALITRQVSLDSQVESLLSQNTEARDEFDRIQGQYYALGAEIARAEQTLSLQKKQQQKIYKELEQTQEQSVHAEQMFLADQEKQALYQQQLIEIEPEYELLLEAEEEGQQALLDAEMAMQEWQQKWEVFADQEAGHKRSAEVQRSHILHAERVLERLDERMLRLSQEQELLTNNEGEEASEQLLEDLAGFDMQLESSQEQAEQLRMDIEELKETLFEQENQLDDLKTQLQEGTGRLSSLETLQQSVLDNTSDGVAKWTMQHGLTENALLVEELSLQEGYEKAIETVLGKHLQAIYVEQAEDFVQSVQQLEKAEISLLERQTLAKVNYPDNCLASKVNNPELASLLANVLLADSWQEALEMRKNLELNQSLITKEGLWLGANWLYFANQQDNQAGFLKRQSEIEQLERDLSALKQQKAALDTQFNEAKQKLKTLEQTRDQQQSQQQKLLQEYHQCKAELEHKKVKAEQQQQRLAQLADEIAEVGEQYQLEHETLAENRVLLQKAIEAMDNSQQTRQALVSERESLQQKLAEIKQKTQSDKERNHQLALKRQMLNSQLQALMQSLQRSQQLCQSLQEKKRQLQLELDEQESPDENLQVELEVLLDKRVVVEALQLKQRQTVEAIEIEQRQTEQQRILIQQDIQQARQQLEQLRLACQGLVVNRENLAKQLQQDGYQITALLTTLADETTEANLQQLLEQLAQKIQRLGAINLAAIEEYQTALERKSYLDQQNEDLTQALLTLENAIRKIDRETRARFKETFEQINQGMQALFPKVFGGGRAYLEMTGDDLLDTGVAIMAQPPGKRNSTIHLLSGGEKALTALSLVFSIFQLNPAPFCMLDEVDAPLDDANVGRYAKMVQEMSSQVQFIYITHNKIAMEMAHQLLGVTMHEPGVSRMVTVNIEEAAELAAS